MNNGGFRKVRVLVVAALDNLANCKETNKTNDHMRASNLAKDGLLKAKEALDELLDK